MALEIRDPAASDEQAWRRLWAGYLAFYRVELPAEITAETWRRIFDPASRLSMRLAVVDGQIVGFVIYQHHESSWVTTPDGYLEDLFVDGSQRGKGIGRALIDDVIDICQANGWSRLYWLTERDNKAAQKLYDTYAQEDGYQRYRIAISPKDPR